MKVYRILLPIFIIILISMIFAGCGSNSKKYYEVAGKYYLQNKSDVIEFKADGKFDLKQDGQNLKGTYEFEDGKINLKVAGGMGAAGKVEGSIFTDNDGLKWIKK